MSKTVVSDSASWPQDIPLQPLTSTTSDTVVLEMEGKSTKTEGENRFLYSALLGATAGALSAYIVVTSMINHADGLVRYGYLPVTYKNGGLAIEAMVPTYFTKEELSKLPRREK